MKLTETIIECKSRTDRFELFVFGDMHIGKRNRDENAIRKQVSEILRRSKMPGRHVRVLLGGDNVNAVIPKDIKRFDFNDMADWFVSDEKLDWREMLGDAINQEIRRAINILQPIRHLIIGALHGNHEDAIRKHHNVDVHARLCNKLEIEDLTDEAFVRLKFNCGTKASTVKVYLRHGYGGGRGAGAEPNKLAAIMAEWEDADICFTGHTHSFCISAPKPVLFIPNRGKLPAKLCIRHRLRRELGLLASVSHIGAGVLRISGLLPVPAYDDCKGRCLAVPPLNPVGRGTRYSSSENRIALVTPYRRSLYAQSH